MTDPSAAAIRELVAATLLTQEDAAYLTDDQAIAALAVFRDLEAGRLSNEEAIRRLDDLGWWELPSSRAAQARAPSEAEAAILRAGFDRLAGEDVAKGELGILARLGKADSPYPVARGN